MGNKESEDVCFFLYYLSIVYNIFKDLGRVKARIITHFYAIFRHEVDTSNIIASLKKYLRKKTNSAIIKITY